MIHRLADEGEPVSDVLLLSESQMERIEPFFLWRTACHAWMTGEF